MAIYYVRPDGNDTNSGLGPATNQAWATINKAVGATSGVVGGDIIYIAPGRYIETVAVNFSSPSSQVRIVGDPSASQFSGLSQGVVRISTMNASGAAVNTYLLGVTSKNNLSFENIYWETSSNSNNQNYMSVLTSQNVQFKKCVFDHLGTNTNFVMLFMTNIAGQPLFATIDSCIFIGGATQLYVVGAFNNTDTTVIKNCLFIRSNQVACNISYTQAQFYNCSFLHNSTCIYSNPNNNFASTIKNCLFGYSTTSAFFISNNLTSFTYNRMIASGGANNVTVGATNSSVGAIGIEVGYNLLNNIQAIWNPGTTLDSPNTSFGNSSGAPTTDMFGVTWSGISPDAGAITYRNLQTITQIYQPTERTNNSFTVSPNTTNRSELIYLGAKGITHTTPSLSASYVRAGAIRTAITLVSQTPNGSWTSGGFCEIDSTNMPGIYRIDVPNAVFVAGAESAILQLTGANTSNGAVVHYNMAKVQFDLSQNVPLSNTAHSIGDALNAARAQGFGKWQIVGNTMNIYAEDGITLVKSFALDSGSYPTQRM
jgi:hypothetical protein